MNIRRQLLLAAAALSLGTASVHAQDNVLRVGTDACWRTEHPERSPVAMKKAA